MKKHLLLLATILCSMLMFFECAAKETSVFDGLNLDMTRDDILEILGNPSSLDTSLSEEGQKKDLETWNLYDYSDIDFMGLTGYLNVWFGYGDEEDIVERISFQYSDDSHKISTFEKELKKIVDFYTEEYGDPEINESAKGAIIYEWKDTLLNNISLCAINNNMARHNDDDGCLITLFYDSESHLDNYDEFSDD